MFNHKRKETPIILLGNFKQVWIENSFVAWVTWISELVSAHNVWKKVITMYSLEGL